MSGKRNRNITAKRHPQKADHTGPGFSAGIAKWGPLAILGLTALLYSHALNNGLTSFDDDFYLLKNPYLRDFSWHGITAIFSSYYQSNYHPLTTLTYFFEFHFFGLNPLPYHLLNVLLHLLNTWLVFKFAEKLSGRTITGLVVSILFAVHPMHVESVAWVAERKDVLYAAFYLLSLLAYLRYLDSGRQTKNYIITLLLFAGSLFSKSAAVTLPVILVIIDIYRGRAVDKKMVLEKVPFLLLSLVFGIINIFAQKAGGPVDILFVTYGILNAIFLFTSAIAEYLIRCAVPFSLSAMHYYPAVQGGGLPWLYYLSLPFLAITVWLIIKKIKNNPIRKEMLFGTLFFLVAASVMLQLISVGSALISERYTYIPYIGLFYIIGQWISDIIERNKSAETAVSVFLVVVFVYSVQTWDRIGVWRNDETLLTDVIEKNPGVLDVNYIYLLRADSRLGNHDIKGAADDYTQAITMNADFTFAKSAYYGRGHTYEESGDVKSAMQDYNKAITLDPKFAEAYNSRGWLYFRSGDVRSAMQDYNTAISLKPGLAEAYNNRGWAYNNTGDLKAALFDYNKAIQLAPAFEKPYYNRGAIKANAGDFAGAIEDYNYLINLHPDDNFAYYLRGLALLNMKDQAGACADWKRAAELGNANAGQMLQKYCH